MKCRRKPKGITARLRASKSRKRKAIELAAMLDARVRDRHCRFPLCGCVGNGRLWRNQILEVSHQTHRGMGGNPAGDRTVTGLLLLVCNWRHKLSKFSIDKKTIRWVPLTEAGADGPIRWDIKTPWNLVMNDHHAAFPLPDAGDGWAVLAVEIAPHEYEPLTLKQAAVLGYLASMSQ